MAFPSQTGVLLDNINAAGVGFTVTEVEADELVHPATDTVAE